jgi:dihydropyrimidinase
MRAGPSRADGIDHHQERHGGHGGPVLCKADVRVEGGRIAEIGPGLQGDAVLDATGCYVMPGGIDPHTHLEMPFMGTYSTDDFESGTRAALAGGTTMVVDFVLPGQGQGLMDAAQMWHNKSGRANCDYSYHMAVTWWGEKVWDGMKTASRRGSPPSSISWPTRARSW